MQKKIIAVLVTVLGVFLAGTQVSAIAWSDEALASTAPSFVTSIHEGTNPRPANQYCTGSLIAETFVLTAAHCFDDMTTPTSAIVGGSVKRRVVEVFIPERYTLLPTSISYLSGFDIAVAELDRPVKGIEPARLPSFSQDVPEGPAYTFGYGLDQDGEDPKRLGAREVIIESGEWAKKLYPYLPNRQISAWGERVFHIDNGDGTISTHRRADAAVCKGDSGGPLLVKDSIGFLLVGVVSYGEDCYWAAPSVYTKVSMYTRWIARVTN